jgi:hypothetical protein
MINYIISTAVKFYLRSQVEHIEDLQIKIIAGDRQILKGYIPKVFLAGSRAVYQGLHLGEIELKGSDIGFNLPEVLKRKPLKLLEPILVDVKLLLEANDLQASLTSPLLKSGLRDLWQIILAAQGINDPQVELVKYEINWHTISFATQQLNLQGTYQDLDDNVTELKISTGISLTNYRTLSLSPLTIETTMQLLPNYVNQLEIDLGTEVAIEQLTIESDKLLCCGKITINN